jgi:hypothetical protein
VSLTVAELQTRLSADISGLEKGLKAATKDIEKATKQFESMGNDLKKSQSFMDKYGDSIESAGRKMSLFVSVPIAGFLAKGVQGASALNEAINKTDVVFGESAKEIHSWAQGAAQSVGLSQKAAEQAAGSFGNMFTQIGFTRDETVKMSKGIVGLAADFASFHDADITQVIEAQSAAFRGEYDSLQRFLPLINAATVEQRAMELTGKANADALTAQEKAAAVYKLMLEGAGPAVGDFARTSDSAANAQRRLKAETENASDRVGSQLLPQVQKVENFLAGTLIPTLDKVSGDNGALVLMGLAAAGPVLSNVKKLMDGVKLLNAELALTAVRASAALGAFGLVAYGVVDLTNRLREETAKQEGFVNKTKGILNQLLGGGGTKGIFGKDFLGLRAEGGPVAAGSPYIVGEKGPELFVPRMSGMVVPNHEVPTMASVWGQSGSTPMSGPTFVIENLNVQSLDPRGASEAVVQALRDWERSNGPASRYN